MTELHHCEICGAPWAQRHEIISRKTGGPREAWNTLWLCADHHTLGPYSFHKLGRYSFAIMWPQFFDKIKSACERMGRTFKKGEL